MPMTEDELRAFRAEGKAQFEICGGWRPEWFPVRQRPPSPNAGTSASNAYLYKGKWIWRMGDDPDVDYMREMLHEQEAELDSEKDSADTEPSCRTPYPSPYASSEGSGTSRKNHNPSPRAPASSVSSLTSDEKESLIAEAETAEEPVLDQDTTTAPLLTSPTSGSSQAGKAVVKPFRRPSQFDPGTEQYDSNQERSKTLKRRLDSPSPLACKKRMTAAEEPDTDTLLSHHHTDVSKQGTCGAELKATGRLARDIGQQVRKRSKPSRGKKTKQAVASVFGGDKRYHQPNDDVTRDIPTTRHDLEGMDLGEDAGEDAKIVRPAKEASGEGHRISGHPNIGYPNQDKSASTKTKKADSRSSEGPVTLFDGNSKTWLIGKDAVIKRMKQRKEAKKQRYSPYARSGRSTNKKSTSDLVQEEASTSNKDPNPPSAAPESTPHNHPSQQLHDHQSDLDISSTHTDTPQPQPYPPHRWKKPEWMTKNRKPKRITPNPRQTRSKTGVNSVFMALDKNDQPRRVLSAYEKQQWAEEYQAQKEQGTLVYRYVNNSSCKSPNEWLDYEDVEARRRWLMGDY